MRRSPETPDDILRRALIRPVRRTIPLWRLTCIAAAITATLAAGLLLASLPARLADAIIFAEEGLLP